MLFFFRDERGRASTRLRIYTASTKKGARWELTEAGLGLGLGFYDRGSTAADFLIGSDAAW